MLPRKFWLLPTSLWLCIPEYHGWIIMFFLYVGCPFSILDLLLLGTPIWKTPLSVVFFRDSDKAKIKLISRSFRYSLHAGLQMIKEVRLLKILLSSTDSSRMLQGGLALAFNPSPTGYNMVICTLEFACRREWKQSTINHQGPVPSPKHTLTIN